MGRLVCEHMERPCDFRILGGAGFALGETVELRARFLVQVGEVGGSPMLVEEDGSRMRRDVCEAGEEPGAVDVDVTPGDLTCDVSEPALVPALILLDRDDQEQRDREHEEDGGVGPHTACIGRG